MAARGQNFKVGLFVIIAIAILLGGVALIAGLQFGEATDRYSIRFSESVSGLDPGSPVKYRGVRVGQVQELLIPDDDITKVEVWIGVKPGTPIKSDTKGSLRNVGITGLMYVELSGGSPESPGVAVGGQIQEQESLLESLTGHAASAAEKADLLLDNLLVVTNKQEFEVMKGRMSELRASLVANSALLNDLLIVSTSAATRLDRVLARTDGLLARNEERIDRSLADLEGGLREMHRTLASLNESDLIGNMNATAEAARDVMTDIRSVVRSNRRSVSETLVNLRETSANMNSFSRMVRDKPSLLIRSSSPGPRRLPDAD